MCGCLWDESVSYQEKKNKEERLVKMADSE